MEITVDSSILVAALRKDEKHYHKCLSLLEKIKDGGHIAIEPYSVLVPLVLPPGPNPLWSNPKQN